MTALAIFEFLNKYWKHLIVSLIVIFSISFSLTYKQKFTNINIEYLKHLEQDSKDKLAYKEAYDKMLLENNNKINDLKNEYNKNLEIKNAEIEKLNSDINSYKLINDKLYETVNDSTNYYTSTIVTREEQIRYINLLDKLYREALEDGRESSEAVERTKIELKQCSSDIDSIYNNYNSDKKE